MLKYSDVTNYFGSKLSDSNFQDFLKKIKCNPEAYDISNGYIISTGYKIELGFQNKEAVFDEDDNTVFEKGTPIFSHVNVYPESTVLFNELPFDLTFTDKRNEVHHKAGKPVKTNE